MMKQNILITSAGKRVVLTEIFKEAIKLRDLSAKVYTTDMHPELAPAGYVSDGCFSVSRCTDDDYLPQLLKLCESYAIGIIVPTIDTELELLAKNRERFLELGTEIIVPDFSFVHICRDKRLTNDLFERLGIRVPRVVDKLHPTFPLFAKPYDGSLSMNLHVVTKASELTESILQDSKLLFMEYIDRSIYKEFTVDMYYGRDAYVKAIVPRERLEIRAGEINKGITRKNQIVDYLRQRMDYLPGVRGCICLQLFYHPETKDIVGIEINPRFGGGYPLSYHAKANYPMAIIDEYLLDKDLSYYDDWADNTLMLRYDKEIVVQDFSF